MALEFDPSMLQGPIPGMSLTQEPGNMPWENPPEYSDIYDVMQMYLDKLLDAETEDMLLLAIDEGAPVDSVAEFLTTSGTMNGRHSLDLAILVNPYVREIIRFMAESANIDYVDSYEDLEKKQRIPFRQVRNVVQEVFSLENEPMETVDVEDMPKGLMAKQITIEEE